MLDVFTGDDNNNTGREQRMDKKYTFLKKFYAQELLKNMNRNQGSPEENSADIFHTSKQFDVDERNDREDSRFQNTYGAESRCIPNLDSERDGYLSTVNRRIKSEHADFDLCPVRNYCSPDECAPSLHGLKIEGDSNDYPSPFLDNKQYLECDYKLPIDQYNHRGLETRGAYNADSSINFYNNNSHHSNFYHHNMGIPSPSQSYYCEASCSLDPRNTEFSSQGPEVFPQMDGNNLIEDEEEPLDLSVPKEEYSSYLDDYADSPQGYSSKAESSEENSWLKKIKTGTRSRVRSPKSWEFLLRLLMDPRSNPSMIKWEDERGGTFRLVQKDEIAKIWGMRSSKHKDGGLSYDNFARNLRYHYKTKMLVPVSEKHLVYRFSPEVMEKRWSMLN